MLKPGPLPPAATTPVAPTLSANLITAWPPRWAPSRGRGWSWWPAGTRTPTCPGTRRHHGSVEHALGIVIPPLQVAHVYPFDRRPWTGPSLRSSLARRLPSSRWTTPGQPPNDRRLRIPPVTLCRYPQTYSIPRGCRVVLVPPCLAATRVAPVGGCYVTHAASIPGVCCRHGGIVRALGVAVSPPDNARVNPHGPVPCRRAELHRARRHDAVPRDPFAKRHALHRHR